MKQLNHQVHKHGCGVVAIVNVLRHFGYNVSYKEILKQVGGVRNLKNGLTIAQIEDMLSLYGFDVFVTTGLSLTDARWFARSQDYCVGVGYCWKSKKKAGSHISILDRKGKALNINNRCNVNELRWKETKELWGFPPYVFIIKEL